MIEALKRKVSMLLYHDQHDKYYSSDNSECPTDLKTIEGCDTFAEKILILIFKSAELIEDNL